MVEVVDLYATEQEVWITHNICVYGIRCGMCGVFVCIWCEWWWLVCVGVGEGGGEGVIDNGKDFARQLAL
jgi:hypothetical protein